MTASETVSTENKLHVSQFVQLSQSGTFLKLSHTKKDRNKRTVMEFA